ncbi:related to isovaleryl-CoA dehydrogenase [Fusarium fujikuroi IMI 58289]|uniref:Related to isovaleryl-CoA dehydrogenase n=1 Tax=Gibberella fujikuroi (strain CBS 195.34 / IMI 58289 / NRRL A-6831) TaxID=1279085 RepID=S0ECW9_GIBF5|nr:related to isovaleryl-CoA dehydrogenase [Fusarium fujikuroi IMI 58289]KLP07981.1 isovaleryl-CoA dehydrogenase [Fusarium fujikuroi]QGI67427.1 hypothetical protein CEK27_011398 [Fusarium fujikuroi]QGI84653.1 hypothetical protein CEK25_011382 [Fusarium fujikuroi]QGI98309.1 hypothetical protein CEK26_011378 [Fusarium fujikuroi]CCT71667.1 related to isovaleryl-CoA dehydrogenase [Fusarium fujikuroi IMI 58289]
MSKTQKSSAPPSQELVGLVLHLQNHWGGSGLGISEASMMIQTIAESGAGMAGAQSIYANVYATQSLAEFGSRKQLEETVPKIVSGEYRVCFRVAEPNVGHDTLRLETVAKENSKSSFSVIGQKIWITYAQVASKMILLVITIPLDGAKEPSECLPLLCIDLNCNQPGLELRRLKKMGGQAVDTNEVFFNNYNIPSSSLIGARNKGLERILHRMNAECCLLAGEALGLG